MTNDIGTSTRNVTYNTHVTAWEEIKSLSDRLGISMGKLLRRITEIGAAAICGDCGERIRRAHMDYYGGEYWELEAGV